MRVLVNETPVCQGFLPALMRDGATALGSHPRVMMLSSLTSHKIPVEKGGIPLVYR